MEEGRHPLMTERVCVIVNPAAGRGRGARMVPEISSRFHEIGAADIRLTSSRGEESHIARAAIGEGFTTLVAVGGDGTTSNIANAILHSGADVRLGVLPAGTGNDFAKVLGTSKAGIRTVAELCFGAADVRVDAGRIEDRFFFNCCGFGFDVAVLEEIGRTPWLRGNSVYVYTALRQLFGYRGFNVAISSERGTRPQSLHMLLVIANAAWFGGMFKIAPDASITNGELDAVSILNIPAWRRIPMLAAATRGTHIARPECRIDRAGSFEVSFEAPPSYEADGELHHAASATVTVSSCPSVLRVVAGPGFSSRGSVSI